MTKAKRLPFDAAGIYLAAAAIGCSAGVLGFGFQQLILLLQDLFFRDVAGATPAQPGSIVSLAADTPLPLRILLPALGGLLAALCLLALRGRRGPFGITDVMEMVVLRRGTIRIRESLTQVLSSLCSIGSGASLGKEAANSQLGATVAAKLADWFRSNSRNRAVLLGCGVGAGMAFSYNAPIAGALFVMEVVLGNFAMDVFAPVVIASVSCTLVKGALLPVEPLYGAKGDLSRPDLVLFAVLLGLVCGVGAIGFRKVLALGPRAFRALRLPLLVSLPLGAALVGLIGLEFPETWGNGYEVVGSLADPDALATKTVGLVLAIMLMKAIATAISTGSGGLGGVFTPTLLVGASLGAVFARQVEAVVGFDDPNQASGFALVGMAGLVAGITHAPITAVLLVFEFTRDYQLILPVMLCSIIASVTARLIDRDSIYSARLRAKGHELGEGLEELAMQTNYVRDLMRSDHVELTDTASFEDVMDVFARARRQALYVVDQDRALLGHVHLHDVKNFINDPSLTSVVIAGDLTRAADPITPEQNLASVLPRFDDPDLEELPVVESLATPRLIGRLTRRDVIALLSSEVLGHRKLRAKLKAEGDAEATYVQLPAGAELARVRVPDPMAGRALDSLDLLGEHEVVALLVIETAADGTEVRHLPRANLILDSGVDLILLGDQHAIERFRAS